jgi:hypothetical protein
MVKTSKDRQAHKKNAAKGRKAARVPNFFQAHGDDTPALPSAPTFRLESPTE